MAFPLTELRDTLTRHQVYLEQVKVFESTRFNVALANLNKDLDREFRALTFDTIDQMTRAQLSTFLRKLQLMVSKQFSGIGSDIIRRIRAFMNVDHSVIKEVYEDIDGRSIAQANSDEQNKLAFGWLAAVGSAKGLDILWGRIANAPIPAVGMILPNFLGNNLNAMTARVLDLVRLAYANKYTPAQLVKLFTGSAELNNKNGELDKMAKQGAAIIKTIYQHVSQGVQAAVSSAYFKCYEWVSVIDDRTTDICRSRDGNIYVYGEGPLPPAHIGCRSNTIPAPCNQNEEGSWKETFYVWLKRQPVSFQNDAIGKSAAANLNSGKLQSEDFPKYSASSGITPEEFKGKLPKMLTRAGQ